MLGGTRSSLAASLFAVSLLAAGAALAPGAAAQGGPCALADGLLHLWHADGSTMDAIGTAHGSLVGGAGYRTGLVGTDAFDVDGVDDWVNLGDAPGNFGPGDFTFDLWVLFDTLAGEQIIAEDYIEGPQNGWTLTKLPGTTILLHTGGGTVLSAAPPLTAGAWHHIALTRAGTTVTLYVDGTPIATGTSSYDLTSTADLKLGHRGNPSDTPGSTDSRGFYLNGAFDEVAIYDRALSATEVGEVYGLGGEGRCPDGFEPVPELSSLLLVGTGLLGLAALVVARRRS